MKHDPYDLGDAPAEGRKDTQRKIIGCVASPGELLLVIDEHRETFTLSRHMTIALIETLARSLT